MLLYRLTQPWENLTFQRPSRLLSGIKTFLVPQERGAYTAFAMISAILVRIAVLTGPFTTVAAPNALVVQGGVEGGVPRVISALEASVRRLRDDGSFYHPGGCGAVSCTASYHS